MYFTKHESLFLVQNRDFTQLEKLGLIISFLLLIMADVNAKDFTFKHYNSEDGLSQISILAIHEDQDGFMWFGTRNGLNYFDGHKFTSYFTNPWDANSLPNNVINAITSDDKGILWIGTEAGLCSYDKEFNKFTRYDLKELYKGGWNIASLQFDRNGDLWIGSNFGIHRLQMNTGEVNAVSILAKGPKFKDLHFYSIIEDQDKEIWLAGAPGLFKADLERRNVVIRQAYSFEGETLDYAESIAEIATNKLLVSSKSKVWVVDTKNFKSYTINNNFKGQLDFESRGILNVNDSIAWVGSYAGVMMLDYKNGEYTRWLKQNKDDHLTLSDNSIHSMTLCKNGDIWVGTWSGGLNYYSPYQNIFDVFQHSVKNPTYTLNSDIINSFTEGPDDKIYVATGRGGVNIYNRETGKYEYVLTDENVRRVMFDDERTLWVGTYYNGVIKYDIQTKKSYYFNQQSGDNAIIPASTNHALFKDDNNDIWVGSWNRLYKYNRESNDFTRYSYKVADINDYHIVEQIIKVGSYLWLITNTGVQVFDPEFEKFVKNYRYQEGNRDGLPNDVLFHAIKDRTDKVWIASQGGLSYFIPSTESFYTLTVDDGLPSNMPVCIQVDNSNNLWISTVNGLAMLNQVNMEFRLFDQTNNLQSYTFRESSCFKCKDGSMLFGGMSGYNQFDPDRVKVDPNEPNIVITDLKLFNKIISPEDNPILTRSISKLDTLVLDYYENVVSLTFVAVDYSEPYKNQYAYMMEGFETEWNEIGNSRTATYTNLEPGTYSFKVRASNGDGVWNNKGTTLVVKVIPPIWMTNWFRVMMILLVIFGAVLFYKLRVRYYKQYQVLLKRTVNDRTKELRSINEQLGEKNEEILEQKEEIENQRDSLTETLRHLEKTQEQLVESEKMASVGTITAGLAHELNNPLNYISGLSNPIKRDLKDILENVKDDKKVESEELIIEIYNLLDSMSDGAKKAATIVKNLLDISPRGPRGDNQLFNVNEIINATTLLIRKTHPETEISVDLKDPIEVYGNQVEINQVLINMIQNGMDAIPKEKLGKLEITGKKLLDSYRITISDNGRGMSGDLIQKIFDPFFTTKDPGQGTGLGLYISYSIIKKHGGKIEVDSAEEHGSTFIITLPLPSPAHELKKAN